MSNLIKPPALKPGDTIGVFAPSSYVEQEDIEKSAALIEGKGYNVFIHPQTYERFNQSAGTHEQKVSALDDLWKRPDIKVVWAAGGGNRALRLLDMIDYDLAKTNPKPLIGFSDVTALLNGIYARTGITGLHGPVFKELHKFEEQQIDHALDILGGGVPQISLANIHILKPGRATGPLIGGCLSLFQYLVGTPDCPPLDGALLMLEDAGDHLSRIDRMFLYLKRQGVFKRIGGLVLGEFHKLEEGARPFGFTLEELVTEYLADTDIPAVINAPFGHGKSLYALPIGTSATLDTAQKQLRLNEPMVNT